MIEQKIEETKSRIEWNQKYLGCLTKGVVKFNEPIWKGEEIESGVEDDLYRIAKGVESKHFSGDEREKLSYGVWD